jgi:HPr kinase/phosphorylase
MVFTPSLTVGALLRHADALMGFDLRVVAGERGLDRRITIAAIQKTGLALAGFEHYLHPGRVLVFGDSELSYLSSLEPAARAGAVRRVLHHDVPCILLTRGGAPLPELVAEGDATGVPIPSTGLATPVAITRISTLLEDRLAPRDVVHGVLLDILGLGVLIVGESGIGKSECALDLIVRGHRLVADDTVEVRRRAETVLIGTCPELTRPHMELRGLGLIDVRELFGIAAVRNSKRVEFVVQLERWEAGRAYERLGLDDTFHELLGVRIPLVRMPVAPGRSVATLVEVAARNQLLRARGHHAARAFARRLDVHLRRSEGGASTAAPLDDDHTEAT